MSGLGAAKALERLRKEVDGPSGLREQLEAARKGEQIELRLRQKAEGELAAALDREAQLQRLLRESLGWMEGVEPKPAAPFLAEIREVLGGR